MSVENSPQKIYLCVVLLESYYWMHNTKGREFVIIDTG